MAKVVRTVTELTDDIDGGEATETVSFALDGASYDIDLNADNAASLRDALASYVGHARKAGRASGRKAAGVTKRAAGGSGNVAEIRTWAKANGFSVSERGRISRDVLEAYEAAH